MDPAAGAGWKGVVFRRSLSPHAEGPCGAHCAVTAEAPLTVGRLAEVRRLLDDTMFKGVDSDDPAVYERAARQIILNLRR